MPVLNIEDAEAYRLASEISAATGKSLARVVVDALREERKRLAPRKDIAKVHEILARLDAMPVLDPRPVEELMDELYDERGLPR